MRNRPVDFEHEKVRGESLDLFENDFIGQIDTQNPQYQKAWKEAAFKERLEHETGGWRYKNKFGQEEPLPEGYLRIKEAMELARHFQTYNKPIYSPSLPEKPFARDIRLNVIEKIEKRLLHRKLTPEERARAKFFVAADSHKDKRGLSQSPLERFHSAKAWLEYTDEKGVYHDATFKLVIQGESQDPTGRNIIIKKSELPDPHLEEELEGYEKAIDKFGEQAFRKMFGQETPKPQA